MEYAIKEPICSLRWSELKLQFKFCDAIIWRERKTLRVLPGVAFSKQWFASVMPNCNANITIRKQNRGTEWFDNIVRLLTVFWDVSSSKVQSLRSLHWKGLIGLTRLSWSRHSAEDTFCVRKLASRKIVSTGDLIRLKPLEDKNTLLQLNCLCERRGVKQTFESIGLGNWFHLQSSMKAKMSQLI
jgi:hypothetical protein